MNPLIRPWKHLFDFRGRATRTEYLLFHITGVLVLVILGMLTAIIATLVDGGKAGGIADALFPIPLIVGYPIFFFTHIAISVRRLHDHGEPGVRYLLTLIPLIGIIFWATMVFARGDDFENEYGPDPRLGDAVSPAQLGDMFS